MAIINDIGMILNPEEIIIIKEKYYKGVYFHLAEYENKWYTGIRINCNEHGCGFGVSIKHSKKFSTKKEAMNYLYDYAITYLTKNKEYDYIEKIKKHKFKDRQLTLF